MNMKRSFIRVFLSLFLCAVIAQFPVMISNEETMPKMLPLFYEYIQENSKTNYAVSWSKWIEGRIN